MQKVFFYVTLSAAFSLSFSFPNKGKSLVEIAPRVVDGSDAKPGDFPSLAAIICGDLLCGGSLINSQWVLTAGYCIYYCENPLVTVQLGSPSLRFEDENRVTVISRKSYVHPDYDPGLFVDNIGLVYLEEPVEFNDFIQPISLYEGTFLQTGDNLTITGWGSTDPDDAFAITPILQYGSTSLMDSKDCEQYYGFATNSVMCTGPGATPCWRDYGSPAIVTNSDGEQSAAGVFAYKKDILYCVEPENYPGLFTRVEFYVDWIRNVTGITNA